MLKRIDVLLCFGSGCVSAGAKKIKQELQKQVREFGIESEVNIIETGCMGPCDFGPLMLIYPEGVFYKQLKPEDMKEVVEEHFVKGRVVERLLMRDGSAAENVVRNVEDVPFYKSQTKLRWSIAVISIRSRWKSMWLLTATARWRRCWSR